MKKDKTNIIIIIIIVLLLLEGIFIINNSKDIKELKKEVKTKEETPFIDERIDETAIDKTLIGTWKVTKYNYIYIVKIDEKGNAEYLEYWPTKEYIERLKESYDNKYINEISEKLEYLDNSKEYMLYKGFKGVLNNYKIVYKKVYNLGTKEWSDTEAKTMNITKTSDYTIKVEGEEFGKQE